MGPSADRVSPRVVLSRVFGGASVGKILLLAVGSGLMLAGFIVLLCSGCAIALAVFTAMRLETALAIYACIPLEQEIARLRTRTTLLA